MEEGKRNDQAANQQRANAGGAENAENAAVATTSRVDGPDRGVVRQGAMTQSGTLNPQTTFGAWTQEQERFVSRPEVAGGCEDGYFSVS